MKYILLPIIICFCFSIVNGQTPFKQIINKPHGEPKPIVLAEGIPSTLCNAREAGSFNLNSAIPFCTSHEAIKSYKIYPSGSFWLELNPNELWNSRTSISSVVKDIMPGVEKNESGFEWKEVSDVKDELNVTHIRVNQTYNGYPIDGQEIILHIHNGKLQDINGFAWTGKMPQQITNPINTDEALSVGKQYLIERNVKFSNAKGNIIPKPEDKTHLTWLPVNGKLVLTYQIEMHPNLMDHWSLFIDAGSKEVLKAYSQLCTLYPKQLYKNNCGNTSAKCEVHKEESIATTSVLLDGPTTANAQDLLGQNRLVNGYSVGPVFYMIDASRSGMFNANQSIMPNEPAGVIWTIDGQNRSPQKDNFEAVHVSNSNNSWDNLEVSAHFNAGKSYEYFTQTFNRNSLNGDGGNIISIINITDENGNSMDNAFWNGAAMFYGNGDVAFQPLAKALDVAGHEMSHGVIGNTANLEYMGQSGALNESFADVFGAMIDRDDWQLGEDVSNVNVFPTGALRDLSNPHNGGNGPNDNGWQPAHMNEFQNLPNTPEGDNGGVHVNSGIPNRAFFLLASSIGKNKAEQIYYKALRDYLVKSSQFIDARIAIEKAAGDLHGNGSAEQIAVRTAFDNVGIGAGQGGDYQEDIETNEGDDFVIATDGSDSDLYWIPPANVNQFIKMNVPAPLSRPSFTDDGTAAVYVDQNNELILLNFNWSGGGLSYTFENLEGNPQGIWRNIVVSKDGSKIAYTTTDLTNEIGVFDFISEQSANYFLFNPTSAEGIQTGDVLYADAMEWDYTGEYVMYDALNRIESSFGDGIEYWDISFLNAWDNASDDFTDGNIGKLYNALPENVSIGNPSFAKNSPYIITFDFVEDFLDQFGQLQTDYWVIAANIESGVVNNIYNNTTIGYPSYSRLDDKILFTNDNAGELLLATIRVQPGDKTLPIVGTEVVLIGGAQKGVWFQTGSRDLTSSTETNNSRNEMKVWPQPAQEVISINSSLLKDDATFLVSDLSGRFVLNGKMNPSNSIDVASLLPGTYFIHINSDKQHLQARFIKQ